MYGPDLTLETKQVDNCRSIETFMHLRFREQQIGGELFDKAFLQEYSACLKTAGQLLPVLHRLPSRAINRSKTRKAESTDIAEMQE